jgi:hypothetical protein
MEPVERGQRSQELPRLSTPPAEQTTEAHERRCALVSDYWELRPTGRRSLGSKGSMMAAFLGQRNRRRFPVGFAP